MATNNQVRGVTTDQLLVTFFNGVSDAFPAGTSVVIDGVSYDKAGLEQKIQELLGPFKKAEDLRSQASTAVKARNAAEPATQSFISGLVKGMRYLFSTDAPLLARLGLPAPKAKKALTAEEKVARKAKAAETRRLRNTMGSRQKADVKATGAVQVTATLPSSANGSTASTGSIPGPTPTSSGTSVATAAATAPQEANGAAH